MGDDYFGGWWAVVRGGWDRGFGGGWVGGGGRKGG